MEDEVFFAQIRVEIIIDRVPEIGRRDPLDASELASAEIRGLREHTKGADGQQKGVSQRACE
jgi:hypothetical protein